MFTNRIIIIEYQLPRGIIEYTFPFLIPPPFYATEILNPLLNSKLSANHDKVEGYLANGEILIKGIETLL